ncbi:hypothetical protein [Natrinema sp. CBA1119]|uniref:DUF7260 family protein n=1 Tax=Natrinema sp. CBA1119 TaxID=1608465 RepID=UPI0020D26303|nr:hypothetical protein [Natrinema sp. CBA1119]
MTLFAVCFVLLVDGQSPIASLNSGLPHLELGTLIASGHIPAAKAAVEREREQLTQERDAFHRFVADVESIPVSAGGRQSHTPVGITRANVTEDELHSVRAAYRRRVMDLNHFDQIYGEQLYENIATELSEDVAAAVVHGDQFSPPVKQVVLQQATRAGIRRERLVEAVTTERESLEYAQDQLQEITGALEDEPTVADFTLTELFEYERRVDQWKGKCARLLRTRQRDIHSEDRFPSKFDISFVQRYLYNDLETDFPVLTTGLQLYSRLEVRQRAVHDEITYR